MTTAGRDVAHPVKNSTVRVEMSGQPSVVTYAGTSPGSVVGLVQINAVCRREPGRIAKSRLLPGLATHIRTQEPGYVTICVTAK